MAGGMFCSAASPIVPGLMRTPSTSTSVWLLSAPRMNTAVGWPGPPVRPKSTPAWKRSSSLTSPPAPRSIAARSMTITGASSSSSGVGMRVAVTTTCWEEGTSTSAADADAAQAAPASSRIGKRIDADTPCMPVAGRLLSSRRGGVAGRGDAPNPAARPPRGWSRPAGRSPGSRVDLAVPPASPSRDRSQWVPELLRTMQARLDYRCGGSAGFGPASRSPARAARDHLSVRAR